MASPTWEVFTYGGGEYLGTVFNAVAAITQNSNYTGLLAVVAMVGLIWVMLEGAFGKELNYKWLLIMIFVYMGFMVPKANVTVVDRVNPAFTRVVANVPFGLAATAGTTSKIGDYLARTFDTVFALPDDLSYSKTGLLFGQSLVMASTRFEVTDSRLAANLSEFWQDCVYYDILLGLYEWDTLLSAPDTWSFIQSNTSQSRSFAYKDSSGSRANILNCRAGAVSALTPDLTAALTIAKTYYGQKLGKGETASAAAAQFAAAMPSSYQQLTGMSLSAEQTIRQAWMANSMSGGLQSFATRVDAGAAAQDFAVARAETERRTTYAVLGELAGRVLPLTRNIFEAFIYGIFPFAFALMLLPTAGKVVMSYVKAMLWLQLWAPLYAILNLGVTLYSTHAATSAVTTIAGGTALSMATNTGLHQALADMGLIAGYLSMSIPMISYMVINQGGAMMAQLAGGVMNSYAAPAAKGAEEATTGNISLSNSSLGNANHFAHNTAPSSNSGSFTQTDGMGDKHIFTSAGTEKTQQAVSSYAMSADMTDAVRSSMTTQAGQSIQAARTDAVKAAESTAATFSNMESYSHAVNQSTGTGDAKTENHKAALASSVEDMRNVATKFAADNSLKFDTAVSLLAGVGADDGIKLDANGKASATSNETYKHAKEVSDATGFKKNYQTATEAATALSATKQAGVSDQAGHDLQAGIQQNKSLMQESAASMQRAESWSQVQSRMKDGGISFTGDITNAVATSAGISRSQLLELENTAEAGGAGSQQAINTLNGMVDKFVAAHGRELVGLEAAPTADAANAAYAAGASAVAGQGAAGIAAAQSGWGGNVSAAADKGGLRDTESEVAAGYQQRAGGTGRIQDAIGKAVNAGEKSVAGQVAHDAGLIAPIAAKGAAKAAAEKTAENLTHAADGTFMQYPVRAVVGAVGGVANTVGGAVGDFMEGHPDTLQELDGHFKAGVLGAVPGGSFEAKDGEITSANKELLGDGEPAPKKSDPAVAPAPTNQTPGNNTVGKEMDSIIGGLFGVSDAEGAERQPQQYQWGSGEAGAGHNPYYAASSAAMNFQGGQVTKMTEAQAQAYELTAAMNFQGGQITGMTEAQTRAYAATTAHTESHFNPHSVNEYGYSGQYQFGAGALADVGLVDKHKLEMASESVQRGGHEQKQWLENPDNWTLRGGQQAFLADKGLQDRAFTEYTNMHVKAGVHGGAISFGDDAGRIAGYAKAAHLKGTGGANKLFLQNTATHDANGTSTATYARQAAAAMVNLAPAVEAKLRGA